MSATVARPISEITSRLRIRLVPTFAAPVRPPDFSISFRFVLDTRIAGVRPKSTPVSTDTPAVNSSTRGSKLKSIDALLRNGGRNDHSALRPQ